MNESREAFTTLLCAATLKLLRSKDKDDKIVMAFIAKLTGHMLYEALTDTPDGLSKDEMIKITLARFASAKVGVQEAIAAAFTGAMNAYSGTEIEYYCQVKALPPVANKEPI